MIDALKTKIRRGGFEALSVGELQMAAALGITGASLSRENRTLRDADDQAARRAEPPVFMIEQGGARAALDARRALAA